ncbi:hypothetical protein Z517_09255 [Fonsecaea pedrosoi CBS 271.37]|uniref:Uncharacterized protein n=1 Tax=Fonsecaea pedrosoi CBS 271.37 TaxID=1442368 RepID=A0A0D2DGJ6_9EURO|nr:uncharacterized protein Z517_09255 [Fonsecaea pedrosoi CBS 271.37]KIW76811.1 hypothetical protein Z517_09255 [Fonsecaea pedrosoi CBS 271.37]
MGNCFSAEAGPHQSPRHHPAPRPHPAQDGIAKGKKAIPSSSKGPQGSVLSDGNDVTLTSTDGQPPEYSSETMHAHILQMYEAVNDQIDLSSLKTFNTVLCVDDNARATPKQQNATKMMTWLIMCLLQAIGAPVQLTFMDYHKPEMRSASAVEQEAATILSKLFVQEEAGDVIAEIRKKDNFSRWLKDKGLYDRLDSIMEREAMGDRHQKMLTDIRKLRSELSEPWKVKNWSFDRVVETYNAATDFVARQPLIVSGLSYALVGLVKQQIQKHAARVVDATETVSKHKFIVVTTTGISETGYNNVKTELNRVRGGDTEFSITTVYLHDDKLDDTVKSFQQKLDDQNQQGKDIYDAVFFGTSDLLEYGPPWELLAKILAGHDPKWDRLKIKKQEYGSGRRSYPGGVVLPSVADVRHHLGV